MHIDSMSALRVAVKNIIELTNDLLNRGADPDARDLKAGVQALQQSYAGMKPTFANDALDDDTTSTWQLSCVLWNSAVDITTRGLCSSSTGVAEQVACIRHVACSMLLDVPMSSLFEGQRLQLIRFCIKTSEAWSLLDRWEQSELLLASAARLVTATCSTALAVGQEQQGNRLLASKAEEFCALVYEVHLARYTAACKTNQQDLAREALMLARAAAEDLAPSSTSSCLFCYKLARSLHAQAMQDIESVSQGADTSVALPLLQDALKAAYDLVLRAKEFAEAKAEGESAGVTAVRKKKLLQLEAKVLLVLAYLHLQGAKDPAACLKCTEALRQLETEEGSHPAVSLLAFQAFLTLGMLQEAEKEATGIAVSDATSPAVCLAVLKGLLEVPGRTAQLKPVLQLVLGHYPSDPHILTTFTELALTQAAAAAAMAANSTDVTECKQQQQAARDLQDLVLEQLNAAVELQQALQKDPVMQSRLRDALYQHGLARFSSKDFDTAVSFFTATLEVCEDRIKGRIARVLAMCHLGQQQLEKTKSFCDLSETYEPGVLATSFIRFKVLLLEGNEAGVVEELSHMVHCADFCNDMLWFAFKEANTANATVAATAALAQLHDVLVKQHSSSGDANAAADGTRAESSLCGTTTGSSSKGGSKHMPECVVLRVWVKMLFNDLENYVKAFKAAQQGMAAQDDITTVQAGSVQHDLQQLSDQASAAAAAACQSLLPVIEVLGKVCSRVGQLGLEVFTGEKEATAAQQLEWFRAVAWNAGLHATEVADYQGAAVLMHLHAQLWGQLPNIGPKVLRQQRLAYLIAASASLEVHKHVPEHTSSLRLASRMCQAATAAAQKLTACTAGTHMASAEDGKAEAFKLTLQVQVALCFKNMEDLQAITQQMIAHPDVGADKLHSLYKMCTQEPHKYPEVANAALEGSLQKLLVSGEPNYQQVAVVVRTLLQRAGSDAAKLKLYREVCGILTTVPLNAYPLTEVAWLLSTCWNRGIHHLKFDRKGEAVQYMQVAVDMLPACPQQAAQKLAMTAELKSVQAKMKCEGAAV